MGSETKQKIINAAIELFARNGFEGTSVRQICQKAGVNVAMINYYFGSKLTIYFSLLDDFFSRLQQSIFQSGVIEEPDFEKKVMNAFELGFNFARNNTDMLLILTREIMDRKKANEGVPMDKIVHLLTEIWEEPVDAIFREDLFPGLPTDIACIVLIGLIHVPIFFGRLFSELGHRKLDNFYDLYKKTIPKLLLPGLKTFFENGRENN